jgi:hypothetical protein
VEFHSTIKKNDILSFAGKWKELDKTSSKAKLEGLESQKLHVLSHMWNIVPIQTIAI